MRTTMNIGTLRSASKSKVTFRIDGTDGVYKCVVKGMPTAYTADALAVHVRKSGMNAALADGFGDALEAKASGQDIPGVIAAPLVRMQAGISEPAAPVAVSEPAAPVAVSEPAAPVNRVRNRSRAAVSSNGNGTH
jgi:hypothetical protein